MVDIGSLREYRDTASGKDARREIHAGFMQCREAGPPRIVKRTERAD
ncbi:hypothetical protein BSLA_01r3616 [Burkholderia stabilis]|nr:hypothetical protein BSLA_01r3616 [Burkholderia stabilis]